MKILGMLSALALGIAAPAALAAPLCPALGVATDCNIVLTIGPGGSVTSSAGASSSSTYDGSDDVLVGIVNNSGAPLSSIALSSPGNPVFEFDGDGIDAFGAVENAGNPDTTGYGGPNAYFSGISSDFSTGTVNFKNPIAAGGTDYFSLEEAITFNQIGGATPEPSTLLLFATGAVGLAGSLRRKMLSR